MRTCQNELYHYGILGQKWGVRNGPPYPLDAKDHSASEKKAGWRRSLKAKSQTKIGSAYFSSYKSGRDRTRELVISDAAKYARARKQAHLSAAKRHQAEYDKLRKKNPDTIIEYRSVQSGVGRNAKHYKLPVTVKDQMRIEKNHVKRHKVLAKNWSAWAEAFEGPMDGLDKRDFKFAKKYAKYQHGGKLSVLDRADYIDAEQ